LKCKRRRLFQAAAFLREHFSVLRKHRKARTLYFYAFPNGKPLRTFPENALPLQFQPNPGCNRPAPRPVIAVRALP
jgi:hypothetical protein